MYPQQQLQLGTDSSGSSVEPLGKWQMRVLLVEDEETLAGTIRRGLRREGMAVDLALDGGRALEKVAINDYDVSPTTHRSASSC